MILNPKIFRAYDIRGKAFVDFDEAGFFLIAKVFGNYISQKFKIQNPKIFVSGDGRTSLPKLWPAIFSGLKKSGCEVIWGGLLPTPMNYFFFREQDFDAAIQISASHNPPTDNGLKLLDREGSLCGEEIQKLYQLTKSENFFHNDNFNYFQEESPVHNLVKKYEEKILTLQKKQNPKKLIVDCGNGIAGIFYPEILRKIGHEITELFCNLDTTFPHHQPDPERPENLKDLIQAVKKHQADFGLAFDGDGDRVGIVLSDGKILSADKILYVLAADFLMRHPGEKIVVDAMISSILIEKIQKLGGEIIMSKTGHSYIEQAMKKYEVKLAGEQSGHFMLGENFYGYDDALLAAIRFLQAIQNNPLLLSEITTHWPPLLEVSEKIVIPDDQKFLILEKIKTDLLEQFPTAETIDGIRINFPDNEWGIIRCSNTSPQIALRIEAQTERALLEKKEIFKKILTKYM